MSLYSVDNIKEKLVISLYAKGMSVSDIEEEMREIYEIELSTSAISIITNKVNQAAQEWQPTEARFWASEILAYTSVVATFL